MNLQQRQNNLLYAQKLNDRTPKDRNTLQYLEDQNLIQNESFQMRKAIKTYFDSQPFSTSKSYFQIDCKVRNLYLQKVQGDKSKGIHSSCSNSYSGDNSDIITAYSQNNQHFANESDLESDDIYLMQLPLKNIHNIKDKDQQDQQYVAKSCYDALQKAYYDLQQKYFNVREEIKENQNQLSSLLTELRSQYQNNQQNSTYSQFSEHSMSSKLEEKFTSQINRAFRIMYENLKEESEKTIEEKEKQIQQLDSSVQQLQKVNEVLLQQNEQKENALMDIVQYYGILKQQIDSIKQEKEQNIQGDSIAVSQQAVQSLNSLSNNNSNQVKVLQHVNTNSSFQQQQQPLNQIENNYSVVSHSSITSKKNVESKKGDQQFSSSGLSKQPIIQHQNSGFSFANGSAFQQDSEKKSKDHQSNKENSHCSIPKQDFQSSKSVEKQQYIKEYETFQTEECDRALFNQQQPQKPQQSIQTPKSRENVQVSNSQQQSEYNIASQAKLNSQIDMTNNFDDQSETVFEDVQAQSAYDWQFTSNQQNQMQKLPIFGEENYVSNDITAVLQSNMGQKDNRQYLQSSSTPNKQFRQLNDYLHTHENNFEQEQEEIQLINQKVKKSNRLNMLAKLKKEVFSEGLKTALNPTSIQTNRKGSTTPRKLTARNSKVSDQMLSTSRSRISTQGDLKSQNINQIDDPIQRGYMIIEELYHSIDKRFQNKN